MKTFDKNDHVWWMLIGAAIFDILLYWNYRRMVGKHYREANMQNTPATHPSRAERNGIFTPKRGDGVDTTQPNGSGINAPNPTGI